MTIRPSAKSFEPTGDVHPAARKRVLFIINSLAGGGAERVMSTLLAASSSHLDRADIRLALLDEEEAAYALPDWLPTIRLESRGALQKGIAKLGRAIGEWRPHVTLSFLTRANLCNVATAQWYGHKAIISERINTSAHFGTGPKAVVSKLGVRLGYPRADAVIAPSAGVADDLIANFGVSAAKTTVIANPVDIPAIRAMSERPCAFACAEPYVVAIGRLTAAKNYLTLIEAYASAGIAPKLVILGQGPQEAELRAAITARGLDGRVILAGFQDNPFAIVRGALAYVSASRSEGFPNSLVEAMAVGVPVISSNCASGPSEILAETSRDAVQGLTFAPHGILVPVDDAQAMARALVAATDATLRARYAEAARERVEAYSVANATRRYWDVIDAVWP